MKNKFLAPFAALALAAVSAVHAQSFPLIPVNVSGTFFYNTNQTINTNIVSLRSFSANFVTRDLISMLTNSPVVSNVVVDVTGSNGIPAGSTLAVNSSFGRYSLLVTNKSGFSFPLSGKDYVTDESYNFGRLNNSANFIPANFNIATNTLAGSETNRFRVSFYFNDGVSNYFSVSSIATVNWTASPKTTNGTQLVSVNFNLNGSGEGVFKNRFATVNLSASGKGGGKEKISNGEFPYWRWWQMQSEN